jgi:hypothetical protein
MDGSVSTEEGEEMSMSLSRERAAQAWCKPTTSHKVMDPELAEAFAEILNEIWSQPWLGNATSFQLLEELTSRAGAGWGDYRTVDPVPSGPTCHWVEDSDGTWNSDCGQAFQFNDGYPSENGAKYCHCCGRYMSEMRFTDLDVESV